MKNLRQSVIAVAVLIFASNGLSCSRSNSSQTDMARLTAVQRDFGDRFEFEPASDIYLNIRFRQDGTPSQEEAEKVYKAFWFAENEVQRKDSAYVYLNVYDRNGVFQFQLYFDPKTQRITRSAVEHY